jgi:hypothetical protein
LFAINNILQKQNPKRKVQRFYTLCTLLLLSSITICFAQEGTQSDTTAMAVPIHNVNISSGSILQQNQSIKNTQIPTKIYYTFTDILTAELPVYPLLTGVPANNTALSLFGAMPSENSLLLNGMPMDNVYTSANYNVVSPEFLMNAEVLYGSKNAIITGKTGLSVNAQTYMYDTKKPYTRLWYVQGDNGLIGVDGTYSQNFLPNWNITAGFRRLSNSSNYPNSFIDTWNARVMLRHNISDLSDISLLYHFNNYYTGDFGGIMFEDYATGSNLLRSNFQNLQNRQYNTDVILTYSTSTSDSAFILSSNLFCKHYENDILFANDTTLLMIEPSGKDVIYSLNAGVNANAKYQFSQNIKLNAGGQFQYIKLPQSIISKYFEGLDYNIYAAADVSIDSIDVFLGGRAAMKYDKALFSLGGNLTYNFSEQMKCFVDVSLSDGEPLPILNFANEQHFLALLGGKYNGSNFQMNVSLFCRNVNNPLLLRLDTTNIYNLHKADTTPSSQNIFGGNVNVTWNIWKKLQLDVGVQNYLYKDYATENNLYITANAHYTYTKNINYITGGIEASMLLSKRKFYYNPLFKLYSTTNLNDGVQSNGLTAYITAKFGNCFVRAAFRNMLGMDYSYLAYYPMPKQEIHLTFTWMFPMK